ncbi:hypothetical protein [Burkholderia multivorans]|uniref:hypothetical protein n=1 Tax=Burkholderia multivorans TaxID=87883 RepID=UPI0011B27A69|nr:hypothetical protein [Burkholderia multivorans]
MHQQIATPASGGSPSSDVTLSLWEAVTRQAIALTRDAGPGPALADYDCALSIARQLIDAPPTARAEDCVAALVVSHHNLADLYIDHGDIDAAVGHLCQAHEALIALMLDGDRQISLRQAALRQSRATHLALVSHVAHHGPHALITHALRVGCLAFNVGNTTRHRTALLNPPGERPCLTSCPPCLIRSTLSSRTSIRARWRSITRSTTRPT